MRVQVRWAIGRTGMEWTGMDMVGRIDCTRVEWTWLEALIAQSHAIIDRGTLGSLWDGWLWTFFTAGTSRSCTRNCRMSIATVGAVFAFLGCSWLTPLG
jgi:hypothetical protein